MATVDGDRVLHDLKHLRAMAAFKTGVHRPSLSPVHLQGLQYLKAELDKIGHQTVIDGIGNVLGVAPVNGRKLLAGSHLESQNEAGWLDGPLGVIYALEAARVVKADPTLAGCGVDVGAWCDEEGHFGNFLGSRSAVGGVSEADLDAATDRTNGVTMRDALAKSGLAGVPREVIDPKRYVGYLEAHIEQGDWLEANKLKIGVVTSIVGIHQYRITFEGTQNHAGTTRMAIRRDAGVACARLCVAIDDTFPSVVGPRTVWTTGRITLDPGAPSIIPGGCEMMFQFRDADPQMLTKLDAHLEKLVAEANARGPVKIVANLIRASVPAVMAAPFQSAFEAAAETAAPGQHTRMPSGAGHDAQVFAAHMPSAMLFVPSIGGISHHWTENTSDEDIVLGAKVFVDAVVRLLKA